MRRQDKPQKNLTFYARLTWLPAILFFVCLGATIFAWYFTDHYVKRVSFGKFNSDIHHIELSINERFNVYFSLLHGAQGLFYASNSVERDEWENFAASLELSKHHPSVKTFRFIERVSLKDKDTFVAGVKTDKTLNPSGYPDFSILPEGDRNEYYVVKYVFPFHGNEKMFGLDLGADPDKLANLESALRINESTVSKSIKLVVDEGKKKAILVTVPVYRKNAPLGTVAERNQAMVGFAQIVCYVDDFLSPIFKEEPLMTEIGLKIYEGDTLTSEVSNESLIYDRDWKTSKGISLESTLPPIVRSMDIRGRVWSLHFFNRSAYAGLVFTERCLPFFILLGGILLTVLLVGIIYTINSSRVRATSLAHRLAEEFMESERRFKETLDNISLIAVVLDKEGRVTYCNDFLAETIGLKRNDIIGQNWFDRFIESGDSVRDLFYKGMENGQIPLYHTNPIRTLGGERKIISWSNTVLRDTKNMPIGTASIGEDVTAKENAMQFVRASEEKLRSVVETARDAIITADESGKITSWNQGASKIFGYETKETIGKDLTLVMPERFRQAHQQGMRRFLSSFEARVIGKTVELAGLRKDGQEFPLEISLSHWELQSHHYFTAIIRDITERKQFEETIRESQEELRALVELAPDPIITLNALGVIEEMNHAAEMLSGYDSKELAGKHFAKTGVLRGYRSLAKAVKEFVFLLKGDPRPPYELAMVKKGGKEFFVEAHSQFIKRPGHTGKIVVVFRDITERKRIENEMRKLSTAVTQSPLSIVITDPNGLIEYVNPKFCELTGYSANEVKGKNPRFLKSGLTPESAYKELWQMITSGEQWEGEFCNKKKSGDIYWETAFISPIKDSEGKITHFIAMKEDITEKKALEEQLLRSQKMEMVGNLAGGIAHDLNNQLTPLLGYIDLILQKEDVDSDSYTLLKEADRAALRCKEVAQRLMNLSKPGFQEKTALNAAIVLKEFRKNLQTILPNNITVHFDTADNNLRIMANETALHTVLMNLATNAKDAMAPDNGIFRVTGSRVHLDSKQVPKGFAAGDYVSIMVQDSGRGMAPDIQTRIFEPFFTTKGKVRGTGLGLFMVFNIVKDHKGWVEVRSQPERGSVFTLFLPFETEHEVMEKNKGIFEFLLRGTETVLYADDEEPVRALGKVFLERLGYKVLLASSGQEAVEIYESNKDKIDLVVLDMIMPGLSGTDTMKRMLKINPAVRILVASGYTEDASIKDILNTGACDFLRKPFTILPLSQMVRKVLNTPKP